MPGLQKEHSGHENMVQVDMLVKEREPLVALDNKVVDQGTKKLINKFENWDLVTEKGGVRKGAMMQHKVQRQTRAVDNEEEKGTNTKMNVDIEKLAPRKVLKGKRGKKDGLVQTQISWFMSLGDSQSTQVEQARQPKRKQGDMVVSKKIITKRQRKKELNFKTVHLWSQQNLLRTVLCYIIITY